MRFIFASSAPFIPRLATPILRDFVLWTHSRTKKAAKIKSRENYLLYGITNAMQYVICVFDIIYEVVVVV